MNKKSLNAKLYFLVLFLVAMGAASSGFGVNRIAILNDAINGVIKSNVPRIVVATELRDLVRRIAVAERDIILETDATAMEKISQEIDDLKKKFDGAYERAVAIGSETGKQKLAEFHAGFSQYWDLVQEVRRLGMRNESKAAFATSQKGTPVRRATVAHISEILEYNQEMLAKEEKETDETYVQSRSLMTIGGVASAALGFLLAFLILRTLTAAIDRVIASLSGSSDEVAKASGQIAAASEELSSACTEQAAALQQTTSAVEELAGMVQKNSENATAAADSAQRSVQSAERGKSTIESMVGAIRQLEQSNQQVADIVRVFAEVQEKTRVIDDIVFQTQLLSFNASVEAARAGEHGKGFAVVAEEVGNLAEMSGTASSEIGGLLESSLKTVETTVGEVKEKIDRLVEEGRRGIQVLEEIVQEAQSASERANEISVANREQSQGIQEINKAMLQLDQATQQNASTSEEAAASAEELSGQAVALQSTVVDLTVLIKGRRAESQPGSEGIAVPKEKQPNKRGDRPKIVRFEPRATTPPSQKSGLKKAVGADGIPDANDPAFIEI